MENSAKSLTSDYSLDPENYTMPDFYQFYNDYGREHTTGWTDSSPYGFAGNIQNWVEGTTDDALAEYNRRKEIKDRAYNLALDSTKYQRAFEDIKRAGYNPWLLLQSSLGAANSQPVAGSSRTNARASSNNQLGDVQNLITSAMKLIGTLAIMAAAA